jgi:NAD(P)-dependent dehydrogenase (short-subunit alcohol dehydrogenase family)
MNQDISTRKVVLVTGGTRGIGKALVEQFQRQGWAVAACGQNLAHLEALTADFKFQCDVASSKNVQDGIQQVLSSLGRLDVLINNAGLAGSNPLDPNSSDDFWHRIMDVNLNGTYYMCKYAAPHLPSISGRIINIASVLALKGVPDQTAYCAAKHGVLGFTRAFAHYLAPRKITVNALCPGWVRTDMAEGRMQEIGITEKSLETSVPLGRIIEPSEVADFAYFLATSPASAMITGQALTIDGGTLP